MTTPQPLSPTPTREVHLPRAPLAWVVAQVRFPAILAIRDPDRMVAFQEQLRDAYPHLGKEQVHLVDLTTGQPPDVHQGLIWRLADRGRDPVWRVSLGVDFVSIDTSDYDSRQGFLDRLRAIVAAVDDVFRPAEAQRLGLRYIDRLTGEAVGRIGDLIRPEILGIRRSVENPSAALGDSLIHLMTEAQFLARDGSRLQGRWGELPPNATHDPNALEPIADPSWVLDLDMFTSESRPFSNEGLLATATEFAECIYWLFRQMVTEEFLRFYGGEP